MATPLSREALLERMRTTFELFNAAEQMMRLNLERRYPDETPEQREERFRLWLHKGSRFEAPRAGGP